MRERRVTRVYVDSPMESVQPHADSTDDEPKTWVLTTEKTRSFSSRRNAATWLARRELWQIIAKKYNPNNAEEWCAAVAKKFPYRAGLPSQQQFNAWVRNRADEILEEWKNK